MNLISSTERAFWTLLQLFERDCTECTPRGVQVFCVVQVGPF